MHFFLHLTTGIVLGLLLGDLLRDRRWLLPCTIGSILPDLIDKPVGEILLPGIIGYSRSLFHSLPVAMLLLLAGVLLLKYRASLVLLASGAGVLSHQFLDLMWREPGSWLDPLLGQPATGHAMAPDSLLLLVYQDFTNPFEWVLGAILLVGLGLYVKRDRVVAAAVAHRRGAGLILGISAALLGILSGFLLTAGLLRGFMRPSARFGLDTVIVVSVIIALTALLLTRWRSSLVMTESAGKE